MDSKHTVYMVFVFDACKVSYFHMFLESNRRVHMVSGQLWLSLVVIDQNVTRSTLNQVKDISGETRDKVKSYPSTFTFFK